MSRQFLSLCFCLAASISACDVPVDPQGTLDRVRRGTIRVGITAQEPWTRLRGEQPGGVEVQLVEQFAEELNAEIAWIRGSEAELLEAVENHELDLVIGGLTDESPWSKRVGMTRPYLTTRWVIGVPAGAPLLEDLSGQKVAVPPGRAVAQWVREEGGDPVVVEQSRSFDGPAAAPAWQITAWDYRPTSIELAKKRHIMAVPPGENGWLLRLEQFLLGREREIYAMLRNEAS